MSQLENIADYKKNNDNLSTSGQPTENDFIVIADQGFKVVVNIRPESEMIGVFDEKLIVENLGLKYYQIPMTFDSLNKEILTKFFEMMELQNDMKIFVHCHRNIRVSVLFALYRILKQEWKKEDAIKELSEMVDFTPDFESYLNEHIRRFSGN
jgi:uncharacterized protein (TIGR01244 family)